VMSPPMIGSIGIVILFVGVLLGVPIAIASAFIGFIGCSIILGFNGALGVIHVFTIGETASYALSVIPLFILMGNFALKGGIGEELYGAFSIWLRSVRGGLAMATTASCAMFGACSGSSLATAATFTKLALPEMKKHHYDNRLSAGSIAIGGTLASLIPPSGMMAVFCLFTEVSLGKLLIAGIIPGALSALLYMVWIHILVKKKPSLSPEILSKAPFKERFASSKSLFGAIIIFTTLLGGIYTGIFSPTEAAAWGAFVVLLINLLRRRIGVKDFFVVLKDSAQITGMIFFIIVGAMIFTQFLAVSRLPSIFCSFVTGWNVSPLVIVFLMLMIYIFLGTFLDAVAMMALTLPIFYPIIESLGLNGIWFGILVVKMTEMALITPPLGLNCYVVYGTAEGRVTLGEVFKGALIMAVMDVIWLILLFAFPQIASWLPSMALS